MLAFYALLVRFLRLVSRVFFSTIEVVGLEHVPAEGPVIFVGNHPNSLMDPMLVTTTCGRRLHFLAKDVLFQSRLLRVVLNTLGAVPVKRRMDHKEGKLDNNSAFDALFALLRQGHACGIFPEGISHARAELAPLKTGAARIALGAGQEAGEASRVQIVPCGLCYFRRTRMRQRVLVQFGAPITVDAERLAAHREDERGAVRALTDDIEHALRALTINAPDFETLRVLDGVRRLYVPRGAKLPLAQRAELVRRFFEHYERLKDEPPIQALYQATDRYLESLRLLGLRDDQLRKPLSLGGWLLRLVRYGLLLFFFLPLALPGLFIHLPVLAIAVVAGDGLTRRKDVIATTKLITTVLLVPPTYLAIAAAVWFFVGPPHGLIAGAIVLAFLPISGWATIRVLERQASLRRALWVLTSLFVLRGEVERLRAERDALAERIWKLVEEKVDPELERIIPPEAGPAV